MCVRVCVSRAAVASCNVVQRITCFTFVVFSGFSFRKEDCDRIIILVCVFVFPMHQHEACRRRIN